MAKGAMEMLEREEEGFRLKSQEEELDDLLQGYSAQYAQVSHACVTCVPHASLALVGSIQGIRHPDP